MPFLSISVRFGISATICIGRTQLFQDQIRPTWIQFQKNLNVLIYDSMWS